MADGPPVDSATERFLAELAELRLGHAADSGQVRVVVDTRWTFAGAPRALIPLGGLLVSLFSKRLSVRPLALSATW